MLSWPELSGVEILGIPIKNNEKQGKAMKNKDFTHLVFPHFSRLTVRIGNFRPQNRIPREKLHIYTSGHVWTPQI